jgi:hypothetical protein
MLAERERLAMRKRLLILLAIGAMSAVIFSPVRTARAAADCGYKADGNYHCGTNCGYKADGEFHCGTNCGYRADDKFHCDGDGVRPTQPSLAK